jgi:hypothetical protein
MPYENVTTYQGFVLLLSHDDYIHLAAGSTMQLWCVIASATALHLYTTLDGTEFLKTANVFDLRFITDSMEFQYPARDVATEVLNF